MVFSARAFAAALPLFFALLSLAPSTHAAQTVGEQAQEFALRDLSGKYVSIAALRGRVILLNFWATWCPPCKDEMPALDALYKRYAGQGVRVLAVASDSSEKSIREFIEQQPVSYTVMNDTNSKVQRQYGVYSIPTTFLIDRRGIVVRKYIGPQDWLSPEFTRVLDGLLTTGGKVGPEIPAAREVPELPFPKRK